MEGHARSQAMIPLTLVVIDQLRTRTKTQKLHAIQKIACHPKIAKTLLFPQHYTPMSSIHPLDALWRKICFKLLPNCFSEAHHAEFRCFR